MKRILLSVLVIGILLLSACGAPTPAPAAPPTPAPTPSLASTPADIAETIKVGMKLGEVYDLIDPEYGKEACYIVNCESITPGPTITFTPTQELSTEYYIWFFIPRFSKSAQPTAVCFHYDSSTDTNIVIAVFRDDYKKVETVIKTYGSQVIW